MTKPVTDLIREYGLPDTKPFYLPRPWLGLLEDIVEDTAAMIDWELEKELL